MAGTPYNGYIKGGIGAALMRQAVEEAGVSIHTNAEAVSLLHEGGAATGVQLADGTAVTARCVVPSLDPKRTFLRLVPPELTTVQLRRRVIPLVTEVSCQSCWRPWTSSRTSIPWDGIQR